MLVRYKFLWYKLLQCLSVGVRQALVNEEFINEYHITPTDFTLFIFLHASKVSLHVHAN